MNSAPITKVFTSWDDIPDVSHLVVLEDSYVKSFKGDINYISYILDDDDKIIAFGSAEYFRDENYYGKK